MKIAWDWVTYVIVAGIVTVLIFSAILPDAQHVAEAFEEQIKVVQDESLANIIDSATVDTKIIEETNEEYKVIKTGSSFIEVTGTYSLEGSLLTLNYTDLTMLAVFLSIFVSAFVDLFLMIFWALLWQWIEVTA